MTAEPAPLGPVHTGDAADDGNRWLPALTDELNRPLSNWFCVLGWFAAAGLFVALVAIFLGPSTTDVDESTFSTWAIQHGQIACAYPAVNEPNEPPVAPLYPLLAAGIAVVTQIGHGSPFPSAAALGPNCQSADTAMHRWNFRSAALTPTTWIGLVGWLALMAGIIAWLRASGRGRTRWEPLTLLVVAALLPVWMCVQSYFHPQDLLALGLALSAMACARRDRWLGAGILCALAVLSQQFALLVAVPLLLVAPAVKRVSFAGAAVVTGAVVVLPLTVMTSGHALRAITLGSGDNPSEGGTVFWETHANGVAAVLLFRVAPIALSLVLSWWVARRLGPRALQPVPLLSLVAVSLGFRLVFEANLFAYYYMALTVCLVLLDVTRGSIRRTMVAWLACMTVVVCRGSDLPFGVTKWGAYMENRLIPLVIGGVAIMAILWQIRHGDDRRNVWPLVAVAAVDFFTLLPGGNAFSAAHVIWFWQIVLVVPGILLAAQPLWSTMKLSGTPRRLGVERASSLAS